MIKIWLDDLRAAPEGWTWVKSVAEAKVIFLSSAVSYASLDHDLGGSCEKGCWTEDIDLTTRACNSECKCGCHETGYDLVKFMAEQNIWSTHKPRVHSSNPAGRANMQATIDRYFTEQGTTNR